MLLATGVSVGSALVLTAAWLLALVRKVHGSVFVAWVKGTHGPLADHTGEVSVYLLASGVIERSAWLLVAGESQGNAWHFAACISEG